MLQVSGSVHEAEGCQCGAGEHSARTSVYITPANRIQSRDEVRSCRVANRVARCSLRRCSAVVQHSYSSRRRLGPLNGALEVRVCKLTRWLQCEDGLPERALGENEKRELRELAHCASLSTGRSVQRCGLWALCNVALWVAIRSEDLVSLRRLAAQLLNRDWSSYE